MTGPSGVDIDEDEGTTEDGGIMNSSPLASSSPYVASPSDADELEELTGEGTIPSTSSSGPNIDEEIEKIMEEDDTPNSSPYMTGPSGPGSSQAGSGGHDIQSLGGY